MGVRPSHQGDPPPSRRLSINQTGPNEGDGARPNPQNARGLSPIFNIDANTIINAKKYDKRLYLIKSNSILDSGFTSLLTYI